MNEAIFCLGSAEQHSQFLNGCIAISAELLSGNVSQLQELWRLRCFLTIAFKGPYVPHGKKQLPISLDQHLATFTDNFPFNFFICLGTDFQMFLFSVLLWKMSIFEIFKSFTG